MPGEVRDRVLTNTGQKDGLPEEGHGLFLLSGRSRARTRHL